MNQSGMPEKYNGNVIARSQINALEQLVAGQMQWFRDTCYLL